jgi:hypothetical protein
LRDSALALRFTQNDIVTATAKALLVSGLPRADKAALAMTAKTTTTTKTKTKWKAATAFKYPKTCGASSTPSDFVLTQKGYLASHVIAGQGLRLQ